LKSQFATSKTVLRRRRPPRAFTEHGVAMAATVLSDAADSANAIPSADSGSHPQACAGELRVGCSDSFAEHFDGEQERPLAQRRRGDEAKALIEPSRLVVNRMDQDAPDASDRRGCSATTQGVRQQRRAEALALEARVDRKAADQQERNLLRRALTQLRARQGGSVGRGRRDRIEADDDIGRLCCTDHIGARRKPFACVGARSKPLVERWVATVAERLELMLRSEWFGRENPWRRQRLRIPKGPCGSSIRPTAHSASLAH
jgi:hypothetical protein